MLPFAEGLNLRVGDVRDVLPTIADGAFDAVLADPPYGGRSHVQGKHAGGHRTWGRSEIAFSKDLWAEVRRVTKPGGVTATFAHPRTMHRAATALEDAGWQIIDTIMWVKSHSTAPGNRDLGGMLRDVDADKELIDAFTGTRSYVRQAYEPVILARNIEPRGSLVDVLVEGGSGALYVDRLRIEDGGEDRSRVPGATSAEATWAVTGRARRSTPHLGGRLPTNVLLECHSGCEPPAHAEACAGSVIDRQSRGKYAASHVDNQPSRLFSNIKYSARAHRDERAHGSHPTQKPMGVAHWLANLITPKDGVILDLFAGAGTLGLAAFASDAHSVVSIERDPAYADIVRARWAAEL